MVAVGVIVLFNQYRVEVVSTSEPAQAEMIQSKLVSGMNVLKEADTRSSYGSGRYSVELPDTLAGKSYSIELGDDLVLEMTDRSYSFDLKGFHRYDLEGSVEGGDVTIFKRGNKMSVRSG